MCSFRVDRKSPSSWNSVFDIIFQAAKKKKMLPYLKQVHVGKITIPRLYLFKLKLGKKYSMSFVVKHSVIYFIEYDSMWHNSLFWGNKRHNVKKSWIFLYMTMK